MEPYSVDQFTSRTIISVSANQLLLDTTVKRVSYYTELYFSCISFYPLLVIPLINCPIKIKYYHNISRAQSHLILRELLWHASLVLSITRYTHTEYESIRSVNRVDRRPPEIYTWNRQWPLMKQKLGEIIGADASTFCLWHSDCDPYFLVRS